MKQLAVIFLLVLSSIFSLTAQEGILFVTTEPLHASIFLDGAPQEETTPLILRSLAEGEHIIKFMKEGYLSKEEIITITADDPIKVLETTLTFPFFYTRFAGEEEITLNGKQINAEDETSLGFTLPEGTYSLNRTDHGLSIVPEYPREKLLTGVDFALITTILFAGGMTAEQLLTGNEILDLFRSPLSITTYSATLLLSVFDIGLRIAKSNYQKNWEPDTSVQAPPEISPDYYYRRGERYLAGGDTAQAFVAYAAIPREHPESPYLPLALYRLSRINILNGNFLLAQKGFEHLVLSYPHPAVYDKACQSLAQLYAREGEWEEALHYLALITYYDSQVSESEVNEQNDYYQNQLGGNQ